MTDAHIYKPFPLRPVNPPDTSKKDSSKVDLLFPMQNKANPYSIDNPNNNPLYLKDPKNVKTDVEYDPSTDQYKVTHKVGDSLKMGTPSYMTKEEYQKYDFDKSLNNYWKERTGAANLDKGKSIIPKINIASEVFDRIFGSSTIDIRPQGSAELIFGINMTRRDDPALDVKQRKTANFDFQEKIQMNVTAKIGDKIELKANYNTEATFEFENKMKLAYEGKEDEIIKKIEAGNVTLPLSGTLITGSQALFGIKTALQFGKTTVTGVFSQQKSKSQSIEVAGGAQVTKYEVKADQYEENKHFFIAQWFRNNYENAMKTLPIINSPVNISKIEVYVTSVGSVAQETRNIIAFQDLGEDSVIFNTHFHSNHFKKTPSNKANTLYNAMNNTSVRNINTASIMLTGPLYEMVSGTDFEKVENARKLSPSEYTFNAKLGFISLNTSLNADEVLAVAYQYTIVGDTTVYMVGDFSNGGITAPSGLIVKLLKSTATNPRIPMWKLMMKNVYALGGYQINKQDFRFNVLYSDDRIGVPTGYLTEGAISGQPLIKVFNLDRLNTQLDPYADGVFDFIDGAATNGGTIQASNGRVFFPVLEPFGKYIKDRIADPLIASRYAYTELYDSTKSTAQQYPEKNKFSIAGSYKSTSGSEISLNAANVPQGSVSVTAGGMKLTENVDYTVDYTLGRVKIINEGILNSGSPIKISLESNAMFAIQTKTFLGARVDHKVNKDFTLGATIINLTERPLTQKINVGDDPISNTIWGVDGTYQTEAPIITKIVDKIPLINTKEMSKVTVQGEFAQLLPGHSRAIGKTGTSYLDDFEGSKSAIDIKNVGAWRLASTPQGQLEPNMFPEAAPNMGLKYGFNRARIAWYVIDPLFTRDNNLTPAHIKADKNQQSNHYVREILETEVFPNTDSPNGQPMALAVLNLGYYPKEKGLYNFDVNPIASISSGIDSAGFLNDPQTRWGGIMRKIETPDFEETNVEYLEFWMMDPFAYSDGENGNPLHSGGDLYFDLGEISEDILRDGRKSYENGLPVSSTVTNVDTTIWGRVPKIQALVNTFDNNPASRKYQDVGLDGLSDEDEQSFFSTYLQKIANRFGSGSEAYTRAFEDPSSDDYHYFRGPDYDDAQKPILDRYKEYNGTEGNSPTDSDNPPNVNYPTSSTTMPDVEDINRDNTLSDAERYFQYRIRMKPGDMEVGKNYITDVYSSSRKLANNTTGSVKWYQFKVPIKSPNRVVGSIHDFKSIRFMRMFMKGWRDSVVLRFATLELVRSDWRKYNQSLLAPGEYIPNDNMEETVFDLSAVNIEENGKRVPIPYVLPPGITRETSYQTTSLQRLNEQSLSLDVCNLQDGDARAIFKTLDFDVRQYKRLKMYIHAEAGDVNQALNTGDVTVFLRLGTDFTNNYYEYEISLTPTEWGSINDADIWPASNEIDLLFKVLQDAKQKRNIIMREPGSGVSLTAPYITFDGNHKITIVGTPNLSAVKTIMIGVRNPKKGDATIEDDGKSKCAEIWVDELRLSDYDEHGGWAATARTTTNLADLGSVSVAGMVSTPGFGSLEKKLDERSKETIQSYDLGTSIELGKFLYPEKTGMKIPMHYDYGETYSTPQYYPLDPDLLSKDVYNSYTNKVDRDSVRKISQDFTRRKSLNFVNVKKNKVGANTKAHIYDIENVDLTYAYTELYHRNIDLEYNTQRTYKGAIGYNFSNNPKNYTPFGKVGFLQKIKAFKLIKDFNFYLMPKMLSFRTDLDKQYQETLIRNTSIAKLIIEPTYVKAFTWNRIYAIKYDLTQSLKVEFNATNNARLIEPWGMEANTPSYRHAIIDSSGYLGMTTQYNHTSAVNYQLPLNKIGFLNWMTVNTRYSADYHWVGAPLSAKQVGNTIENSNNKQINGQVNMTTLYNKVGFLKSINQPKPKNQPKKSIKVPQKKDDKKTPKKKTNKKKKSKKGQPPQSEEDSVQVDKPDYLKMTFENTMKFLMGVKNISLTYTQTNGTFIPGYMPRTQLIGQDWNKSAPGADFLFGYQDPNFINRAGNNGWITKDSMLNTPMNNRFATNLSARSTVEPIKDLRIELSATRSYTNNKQKYYKYVADTKKYDSFSPTESGNFSISFLAVKTAFIFDRKDNTNAVFDQFKKNRMAMASRLAGKNPDYNGAWVLDAASGEKYPDGYGPTSQSVLIPAFIAAYSKQGAYGQDLGTFPMIPMPNWRITYDGFSKIDLIKKYFKTFTIGHGYRCTYNVGSYISNVSFRDADGDGFTYIRDAGRNYLSKEEISQVSISEQFSPLINIDMTWQNSLLTKLEVKKSRDLSLSLTNNQLTEVQGQEYVVGLGYRIKDVEFGIKSGGKTKKFKSDLNLLTNVSIRTNKTVLRKIVEDVNQVSTGQRIITINNSADYVINQRFTIRLFFDKIITTPFVSSQFPNANTNAGISIKFTLAQ